MDDPSRAAGPSRSAYSGPKGKNPHTHPHPSSKPAQDGIPGVSKLKSQIRQTTRLLAKDTLEPQLRIQTERRLASLQADLSKAQTRGIEQKNGEKYHMVKFFERKKSLRIIHRTQKQLAALPEEDPAAESAPVEQDTKSKKKKSKKGAQAAESERARLERELWEARVMLNYIIHYSNIRKYISLFPAAAPTSSDPDSETGGHLTLPPLISAAGSSVDESTLDEPSRTRLTLLRSVQEQMRAGELSGEPEKEVEGSGAGAGGERKKRKVEVVDLPGGDGNEGEAKTGKQRGEKKRKKEKAEAPVAEVDDFFE